MQAAHLFTGLALTGIASFVFTGQVEEDLLWGYRAFAGGCAVAAAVEYRRQGQEPEQDLLGDAYIQHEQEIAAITAQMQSEVDYWKQQVEIAVADRDSQWQSQMQRLIDHYEQQIQSWAAQSQEDRLLLDTDREELVLTRMEIEQQLEGINNEREILYSQLDQERQELEKLKAEYEATLNQKAEDLQVQVQQEREQIQSELQAVYEDKINEWIAEIDERDRMIAEWQQRYYAANGLRTPSGSHGYAGHVARLVMNVLEEFHTDSTPLLCDFEDAHQYPDGTIELWFRPRHGVRVKSIRDRLEDIRMRCGAGEPDFVVEDDVLRITFTVEKEIAAITRRTRNGKTVEFTEPSPEQLRYDLLKSNHYGIFGGTGGGKSTLLNNIIGLVRATFGVDLQVVLIDPKFPDTPWKLEGQEVLPQFYGYSPPGERRDNDSLAGILEMAAEVRGRLEDATEAKLNHRPMPERHPILYVIDEAEDAIAHYGSIASDAIKSVLRVGRSTKVVCCILGQSPNCSAYDMQKANMLNLARFWLSDTALKGMDDCNLPRERRTQIREEIMARQELAEEQRLEAIARGDMDGAAHPPAKFFALVKPQGLPPYLASLPAEGAFSSMTEGEISLASVGVPEMGIEDLLEQALEENEGLLTDQQANYLDRVHGLSDAETIAMLPEAQRSIVELAKRFDGSWITISTVRSNRRQFRDKTAVTDDQIIGYFQAIADAGIGETDGTRFRYGNVPATV